MTITRIPLTPPVVAGIIVSWVMQEAMNAPSQEFREAFDSPQGDFFDILRSEVSENGLFDAFISNDHEEDSFFAALSNDTTWVLIRSYLIAFRDQIGEFPTGNIL